MADVTPEQPMSGQWSPQQRHWSVSKYYQVRSFKKIQAEFSTNKKSMRNSQIKRGYRPGSRNLSCMGQLRTSTGSLIGGRVILEEKVRDEAMINRVREDIENFPKRGLRKRRQTLRLCYLIPQISSCGVI